MQVTGSGSNETLCALGFLVQNGARESFSLHASCSAAAAVK
jgi:hypothetical protein